MVELPEDALAEILRRLPPRSLAASRCVCKDWRSTVDSRRLLRTDLLPLPLAGLFINYNDLRFPDFFSRSRPSPSSSTTAAISGKLDFLPLDIFCEIASHCNGLLLLLCDIVVNPATRRWARLPPLPRQFKLFDKKVIVFDPTVSLHYEVFRIPFPQIYLDMTEYDTVSKDSEWPPSLLVTRVFSSATGRWEERSFARQGDAAGTVSDALRPWVSIQGGYVYWQGALYVNSYYLMRISMSDGKYQVIKHPMIYSGKDCFKPNFYIGKSEKGVYLISLGETGYFLSIWVLNESSGHFEWLLKHQNNLQPLLLRSNCGKQVHGPWILRDINYHLYRQKFPGEWNLYDWHYDPSNFDSPNDNAETLVENNFEWDSDDDNVVDTQGCFERCISDGLGFLGFHPYKEVIFLNCARMKGLAYHLNSTKLEHLGNLQPKDYSYFTVYGFIECSFPYTPCGIDVFPKTIISPDNLY
uniref:F-box domain-containing protein n=1 Tax=Leersia perrieri TaxID=77586 RepID=A0A0D9VX08_9ORYZ